jgi:hypothetical protein
LCVIAAVAPSCTKVQHTLVYPPHEPLYPRPKYMQRVAVLPFADEQGQRFVANWPMGFIPLVFYQKNCMDRPDEALRTREGDFPWGGTANCS